MSARAIDYPRRQASVRGRQAERVVADARAWGINVVGIEVRSSRI